MLIKILLEKIVIKYTNEEIHSLKQKLRNMNVSFGINIFVKKIYIFDPEDLIRKCGGRDCIAAKLVKYNGGRDCIE